MTELVGPAGVGKTELCMTVAAQALIEGHEHGAGVIYLDTEGSFRPSRFAELLQRALLHEGRTADAHALAVRRPRTARGHFRLERAEPAATAAHASRAFARPAARH